MNNVAVLGAGSWGSTLSWMLANAGRTVRLWTQDADKAKRINTSHHIERPLRIEIPEQVTVSSDLAACIENADVILFACTSQSTRSLAERLKPLLTSAKSAVIVSAVKGLELHTLKRMSEVISDVIPEIPVCSLSGPNLAAEILSGLPTASVIACSNVSVALSVQKVVSLPGFRVYSNADLVGVELGGTLKNVIAIAAGASDGLNLGSNAKAALLTRGLAEMTRLAVRLGAQPATLSGLAGMGDLVATCAGPNSRNYRLGMEFAQGKQLEEVLTGLEAIAEGVPTAEAVCELSKRLGLELPIAEQVNAALKGKTTPKGAIMTLMARPPSSEY
ncbi:MAG TPA: NAD(P)H-dependent glycerol-3-phosphate dehydrogenase [Drouetiella sp.]